ncbi:hypothetical protein DU500_09100 [Haloplanus rubicundus]|uniref:Uncharacterized protein n=1 Tax=Haloplanus rubicundus TaxID=1547898 RepID=A0A345E2Z8_9EURY|nr:hypothetical protein [Haloplanus rubicundus]AXG06570.1 hypothetical protein DU500_09100 [Haloplanus rubicundus]
MTLSDDAKVVSGTIAASFSTLVAVLILLFSSISFGWVWIAAMTPPVLFLFSWHTLSDDPLVEYREEKGHES